MLCQADAVWYNSRMNEKTIGLLYAVALIFGLFGFMYLGMYVVYGTNDSIDTIKIILGIYLVASAFIWYKHAVIDNE